MQSAGSFDKSADSSATPVEPAHDPWQPPRHDNSAASLSWPQRLIAATIGVIVGLSAAVTLTAFLFGVMVALGGQSQPGQVDPWETMSQGTGRWVVLTGIAITCVTSLFLGFFAWMKMIAVWQRQQLHRQRRQALQEAVGQFRQARQQASGNSSGEAHGQQSVL